MILLTAKNLQSLRSGLEIRKTSLFGLRSPLSRIPITIEHDPVVCAECVLHNCIHGTLEGSSGFGLGLNLFAQISCRIK
jgi:hypothetical protein